MKAHLRRLFSPILNIFETGESGYSYKPSRRPILIAVGGLFFILSLVSLAAATHTAQLAAGLPVLIFFFTGFVCAVVGFLGTDQAVAKMWGNK